MKVEITAASFLQVAATISSAITFDAKPVSDQETELVIRPAEGNGPVIHITHYLQEDGTSSTRYHLDLSLLQGTESVATPAAIPEIDLPGTPDMPKGLYSLSSAQIGAVRRYAIEFAFAAIRKDRAALFGAKAVTGAGSKSIG